jgi:hypothetical protein
MAEARLNARASARLESLSSDGSPRVTPSLTIQSFFVDLTGS